MRFKLDWLATVHVMSLSVWPWRRLRKTTAACVSRGFWEVKSFCLSLSFFFFFKGKEVF